MHWKSPLSLKPFCEFVFCGVSKTCTVDITHGWNMHALCEQRFGTRKHLERMHFNLILVFGRFFLFTCQKFTAFGYVHAWHRKKLFFFSQKYTLNGYFQACITCWYFASPVLIGTPQIKNVQSHIIRHKTCNVASKCLIFAFFWLRRNLRKI